MNGYYCLCILYTIRRMLDTEKQFSAGCSTKRKRCEMHDEKVADGTISEWASGNTFYYVMFDVRKKHTIIAVTKELTQKLNELNSADGDAIEVRSLIILKQI